MEKIKFTDYQSQYKSLINFSNNKFRLRHSWFSFVEGFSSEFVRNILGEQFFLPKSCLDIFGGVGTTALTCQQLNIDCHSIEVNPFIFDIAGTKLFLNYEIETIEKLQKELISFFKNNCRSNRKILDLESKTFFEEQNIERGKWILDKSVTNGILDILAFIEIINEKYSTEYGRLFLCTLATNLIDLSNVYRNGKALSFKQNWKEQKYSRKDVHNTFLKCLNQIILVDLKSESNIEYKVNNYDNFIYGDSREKIFDLPNDYFDIVITSPPYLNSRDYTDVYRLELWILGYINSFVDEQFLRKSSVTSHVQVYIPDVIPPDIPELNKFLNALEARVTSKEVKLWNENIIRMIKGYFVDMGQIIAELYKKVKRNGKVYINVSNSAYGGLQCFVDEILARIGEKNGFVIEEIRIARYISSSNQQNLDSKLRESVIVLSKR